MSILSSAAAAAVLGLGAVIFAVPDESYGAPCVGALFPRFCKGIEEMNEGSLVFLAMAGFVPAAFGRAHPLLIGLATMSLFPVMSFAEILADAGSHNLWPIEWFLYGVASAPGIAGAYLARWFRRSVWEPGQKGVGGKGDAA